MTPRTLKLLTDRLAAASRLRNTTVGYGSMSDEERYLRRLPVAPHSRFTVLGKPDGIALPTLPPEQEPPRVRIVSRPERWPWRSLNVGDSFRMNDYLSHVASGLASKAGKRTGRRFATKTDGWDVVVTRIA